MTSSCHFAPDLFARNFKYFCGFWNGWKCSWFSAMDPFTSSQAAAADSHRCSAGQNLAQGSWRQSQTHPSASDLLKGPARHLKPGYAK